MRKIFVFDMDDTLIDSGPLVRRCYEQAAKELNIKLPLDYWGKAASQWGCSPELHKRKTELYKGMIPYIQPGWAWEVLLLAVHQNDLHYIWTGASFNTVTDLSSHPLMGQHLAYAKTGMTTEDKRVEMLRMHSSAARFAPRREIHYYDDNEQAAERICEGLPAVYIHTKGAVRNACNYSSSR